MNSPLDGVPFDINGLRGYPAFNWETVEAIDGVVNNITNTENRVLKPIVKTLDRVTENTNNQAMIIGDSIDSNVGEIGQRIGIVDTNILASLNTGLQGIEATYGGNKSDEGYYLIKRQTSCNQYLPFVELLSKVPSGYEGYGPYHNSCLLSFAATKIPLLVQSSKNDPSMYDTIKAMLDSEYERAKLQISPETAEAYQGQPCGIPINQLSDIFDTSICPVVSNEVPVLPPNVVTYPPLNPLIDYVQMNAGGGSIEGDYQNIKTGEILHWDEVSPLLSQYSRDTQAYHDYKQSQQVEENANHDGNASSPVIPSINPNPIVQDSISNTIPFVPPIETPIAKPFEEERLPASNGGINISGDCCNLLINAIDRLNATIGRIGSPHTQTINPSQAGMGDLQFTINPKGQQEIQAFLEREDIPIDTQFDVANAGEIVTKFNSYATYKWSPDNRKV